MLIKILIGIAVLVAVLAIVISLRPATFRTERSATFAAPAGDVFAQINDLKKFQDWSPWAKIDPNCKVTFSGPATGTGSGFAWEGNNKVGAGRMTIIESRPNELVRCKLEFLKPFEATNTAEFALRAEGSQTKLTWAMYGENNFLSKAFGLFVDCDKMIGGDFEKGLASLKTIVEQRPAGVAANR